MLQQKYRDLIHRHLGKLLDALYADFTGLHFHIAWMPALPASWSVHTLPTGRSVCCRLTGSPLRRDCRACGTSHLARTLSAGGQGHHFICRRGVRNYWISLRVRRQTAGIAYLQALENATARARAAKRLTRAADAGLSRAGARVLSRREFTQAARFLRHIVQHVQIASMADLRQEDLTHVQRALQVFANAQARLRKMLNEFMPALRKTPPQLRPASHPEQIVSAARNLIAQDYGQPITLHQCAARLGLNAAYLSHLFSRHVGLPFKTYLTEVRLEKARELLSDPALNISQVAAAVGYASDNRFRIAFKKATGLSPNLWRETLRMPPAPVVAR